MSNLNVEDQEDSESCSSSSLVSCEDAEVDDNSQPDEPYDTESDSNKPEQQLIQIQKSICSNMYIFCRELCFLILIVFAYAALNNNMPKISRSPNAFPFFPSGSIVKDWYRGQLSEAIELASESDLAFVMYYAPWDAESQAVRHEFNVVAQHMYKYIHFAAINCWHPGSECRQQYSKVYSWPVLMAYPAHGRGIQYRGPRRVEHMLKFLQSVSNPITRIHEEVDTVPYQSLHDAVVVGYVDAKLGTSKYGAFYSAALRFLERDPFREIQFLVMTGHQFGDSIKLHLWNETLTYSEDEWRAEPIIAWISENLHQVSVWASPPGGKSQSLSNYLQPGPALILFTPRNPLYSQIDYYTVLHDIALDYYNCFNSLTINLQRASLNYLRKEFDLSYKHLKTICLSTKRKKEKIPTVVTYQHKLWINNTCNFVKTDQICNSKDACSSVVNVVPIVLNKEHKKEVKENETTHENTVNVVHSSIENDPYAPEHLQQLSVAEKCRFFCIAHRMQPSIFAPLLPHIPNRIQLTGLSCRANKSLSILALDSIQHHHFAEGLGIDILNKKDKSAVVIINPILETHHVMQTPYNTENLQDFIRDFTKGSLDRTLSSTAIPKQHTHQYGHQDLCHLNRSKDTCIHELSTSSFMPTVMQPNMAVVVLYYSVKCAFCSGISHTLLTTARVLAPVNGLYFARIDGDNHALPWEFTMHHYPSLLFFPAKRKAESRVFSQNVPITVPNIISFILANVEPNIKLNIMWTLCKQTSFAEEFENCKRTVRIETMTQIGQLLKVYRFTSDISDRTKLLKRLQLLRSLHVLLANSSNRNEIQNHITSLNPISIQPNRKESGL